MQRWTDFRNKALIGYAAITLLLAGGMALTIDRLDGMADVQVARLRAEENGITLAERLRWNSELLVSDGRGYLLSGEPNLLKEFREREVDFDASLRALKGATLSPAGGALVQEVERAAARFGRAQAELMHARQLPDGNGSLSRRFELELLPLRHELERTLARLIDHKHNALGEVYARAQDDRTRLVIWMYVLAGVLVSAGIGLAWHFSKLLVRSYRKEQEALDAAHEALAARNELMGIVAHDLRNPLNAIALKAGVLRMRAESEQTRQQAASIENVTSRMAELIASMLDVTTLEAGRFSVKPALCDVDSLVRDVMEMFSSLSASRQVELKLERPERGLEILADRERLIQVLSNLLGNALKFTSEGGTSCSPSNGRELRFASPSQIRGPGITAEHLPHVFDRLWKHDATGMKGTGLGLFIAKSIVDAHGGRIWVESQPERGAKFHFTLPTAESTQTLTRPAQALHQGSPP